MNEVSSPVGRVPAPLRRTAGGVAAEEQGAGQDDTRAAAAVRAARITGLLWRKR